MTTMAWVISGLTFWDLSIALLWLFICSCLYERLAKKGPMMWPVLGILPTIVFNMSDVHNWCTRALIKAGGTFHYRGVWMGGAYGIMTTDPSNDFHPPEKFRDLLGDGIFNSDDESWKQQRQLVKLHLHSSRFIQSSFETMQDVVQKKLLVLLEKFAVSGQCFDLQEVLLRLTFDNICIAALGVDPGCLALGLPDVPFAKAFEEATEFSLLRFLMPPFVWKPFMYFGLGTERRLKEAIKVVHDFADETVRDRRNMLVKRGNLNGQSDLLSMLMESEQGHFPGNFLRDFCVSFILAGRDTTSVALAWFFWLIQRNPDVENKILAEIHEANTRAFTEEGLKKMVYLQAALSESLRLYPSVPIEMKQVREDDVFPDGTRVKKGAQVFHHIFSMGRVESIWGNDCSEFKPERWMEDGKFVSANQFKYPVFNAGPRLCPGKNFAYTQMKLVAASLLLSYSVRVVQGHSVVPKLTTTLYMKNGLMVTLNPRSANNA
ncbi:hypothetical protein GQ457_04G008130 [Hibiscus cannabinus]